MAIEEIRRKCADYNAFQNIGLIPRWTDKLSIDNYCRRPKSKYQYTIVFNPNMWYPVDAQLEVD